MCLSSLLEKILCFRKPSLLFVHNTSPTVGVEFTVVGTGGLLTTVNTAMQNNQNSKTHAPWTYTIHIIAIYIYNSLLLQKLTLSIFL